MDSENKRKPNLFLLGAAKCGTTSIFTYLSNHPDVFPCAEKEPNYFLGPDLFELNCRNPMRDRIVTDGDRYLSLFSGAANEKYLMDGSILTLNSKSAMQRIKEYSPDCKTIIMIRNPVDRLISHYSMHWNKGTEKRTLDKYIKNPVITEGINHLDMGLYSGQIENAFEIFGRENVLLLLFDDLKKDRSRVLDAIYDFLGIDHIYPDNADVVYLKSRGMAKNKYLAAIFMFILGIWMKIGNPENKFFRKLKNGVKKVIYKEKKADESILRYLYEYYREDVGKTEIITGFDLSGWKR